MKTFGINVALVALLVGVAGFSTPSRAETGQVAVELGIGITLR